jgi:aspartyl/glutamyl-tRNA(Asn/Gln) amidotransferase C subunit
MVDRQDVAGAARMARLRLDATELDRLTAELADIIRHVAVLREADLSGVPPFSGFDDGAPLRPDTEGADPLVMPPGSAAPAWADGFFVVPRLAAHRKGKGDR